MNEPGEVDKLMRLFPKLRIVSTNEDTISDAIVDSIENMSPKNSNTPDNQIGLDNLLSLGTLTDYTVKYQVFEIERLSRKNARKWFKTMKKELMMQASWKVVEKYLSLTVKDNDRWASVLSEKAEWLKSDLKAQKIITHGLEANDRMNLKVYQSSGEMWMDLENKFIPNTNTSLYNVLEKMFDWKLKSNQSGIEGLRKFCRLRDDDIEISGEKMDLVDKIFMCRFFKGLGERYNTFWSAFLASGQEMNEQNIVDQLERHERFERSYSNQAVRVKDTGHPGKGIQFHQCRKFGHKAADCWDNS